MQPCPQCQSLLEPWEVFCHGCGRVISLEQVPVVKDPEQADTSVQEAFDDWFNKGKEATDRQDFEAAAVCFQEALRRTTALENALEKEMTVRSLLASVLESNKKLAEAAEQYKAIAERSDDSGQRDEMSGKADKLKEAAVVDAYSTASNDYRAAEAFELKLVPLFCAACKRRLTEGELYGFRKGLMPAPRCVCGFEGMPLVKRSVETVQAYKKEEASKARKSRLIEAATGNIPNGKNKTFAAMLAIVLGAFGAHKFYLGEHAAGLLSVALCWTFVPWIFALFEATQLLSMSQVSFNLQYNIEAVLQRLPPEVESSNDKDSVFSMEIVDDPEDFIDDLSGTETVKSKPE